jgi:hypothetical protein
MRLFEFASHKGWTILVFKGLNKVLRVNATPQVVFFVYFMRTLQEHVLGIHKAACDDLSMTAGRAGSGFAHDS